MESGGEQPDMTQLMDVFETCGVDPLDLQPGGS